MHKFCAVYFKSPCGPCCDGGGHDISIPQEKVTCYNGVNLSIYPKKISDLWSLLQSSPSLKTWKTENFVISSLWGANHPIMIFRAISKCLFLTGEGRSRWARASLTFALRRWTRNSWFVGADEKHYESKRLHENHTCNLCAGKTVDNVSICNSNF